MISCLPATNPSSVCGANQFRCGSSTICIDDSKVCDKHPDCPHGDDETKCGECRLREIKYIYIFFTVVQSFHFTTVTNSKKLLFVPIFLAKTGLILTFGVLILLAKFPFCVYEIEIYPVKIHLPYFALCCKAQYEYRSVHGCDYHPMYNSRVQNHSRSQSPRYPLPAFRWKKVTRAMGTSMAQDLSLFGRQQARNSNFLLDL